MVGRPDQQVAFIELLDEAGDVHVDRLWAVFDGHGVGCDRDQRTRAVQPGLLEQAATPPQPGQRRGRAGGDGDAVRCERQSRARGQPGHHLVAAIRAGGKYRRGVQLVGDLLEDGGQGVRRERRHGVHVHRMHRVTEPPRERQRLPRRIAPIGQDQDAHKTPALRSNSTTAGAAAAPLPSDSARRPWPAGTARLTSSSRGSGGIGATTETGLLRARMRPGTDG